MASMTLYTCEYLPCRWISTPIIKLRTLFRQNFGDLPIKTGFYDTDLTDAAWASVGAGAAGSATV